MEDREVRSRTQATSLLLATLSLPEVEQRTFSCLIIIPPTERNKEIIKFCFPQKICINKAKAEDEKGVTEMR